MSLHHKYSSEDLRRANEFLNSQAGVSFLRFIEECCAPSADHSSEHMSIVSAGRFEQHREIIDMIKRYPHCEVDNNGQVDITTDLIRKM